MGDWAICSVCMGFFRLKCQFLSILCQKQPVSLHLFVKNIGLWHENCTNNPMIMKRVSCAVCEWNHLCRLQGCCYAEWFVFDICIVCSGHSVRAEHTRYIFSSARSSLWWGGRRGWVQWFRWHTAMGVVCVDSHSLNGVGIHVAAVFLKHYHHITWPDFDYIEHWILTGILVFSSHHSAPFCPLNSSPYFLYDTIKPWRSLGYSLS